MKPSAKVANVAAVGVVIAMATLPVFAGTIVRRWATASSLGHHPAP
jgi:hypothetical protein